MENSEDQKIPAQESAKPSEAKEGEAALNFESPEAPEKLKAEAVSETAALEAGGLPVAEHVAVRLDAPLDETTKAELAGVVQEAESAKAELDASLETRETVREMREYRDAEGKLLGIAVLEYAPEEIEKSKFTTLDGRPGKCRRLLSFKMQGEKDGRKTETDLLALAKTNDTEVWIATETLQNYYSQSDEKYVTAPPLDTPVDVATLMHELGHADQRREDRFKDLSHEDNNTKLKDSPSLLPEELAKIRTAFPEAGAAIDRIDAGFLSSLNDISARAAEAAKKSYELGRKAEMSVAMKDDVLRETALAAFNGGKGIEELADRLHEASPEERPALLEQAGFQFPSDAPPLQGEAAGSRRVNFGKKHVEGAPAGLPREAAKTDEDMRRFLATLQWPSMKEVSSIDEQSGTLELSRTVDVRGEKRTMRLKLDVGADGLKAMKERQAAKDAEAAEFRKQEQVADAERQAINAEYDAKLEERQVPMLLNMSRNVLERDATRRAFEWMRTLRNESGVDLFAKTMAAKESLVKPAERGECVSSVTEALTGPAAADMETSDARSDLSAALKSYGARDFRFKNPDDPEDIGIMPMPGSDRK